MPRSAAASLAPPATSLYTCLHAADFQPADQQPEVAAAVTAEGDNGQTPPALKGRAMRKRVTMSKPRREQIEEMLALDPDDSFLRYGLAMEHASAGDDAAAVACLRELLRRDPDYVPAYLQAGQALMRLGDDEPAREMLKSGIAVATRKGDAHAAGEMTNFLQALS